MTTKQRVVTRSRPSLSCVPCKRRKVKCEKQHPTCGNCLRLKDDCWYKPFDALSIATETSFLEKKRKSLTTSPHERVTQLSINQHQSDHLLQRGSPQESLKTSSWNQFQPTEVSFPSRLGQANLRVPTTSTTEQNRSQDQYHNRSIHSIPAFVEHHVADGDCREVSGARWSPEPNVWENMHHPTTSTAASHPHQASQKDFSNSSTSSWPSLATSKFGARAPTSTLGASRPLPKSSSALRDYSSKFSSSLTAHRREGSKPSGHMNGQLTRHAKYVGNSFWALAGNNTETCDHVLQTQYELQKITQFNQQTSSALTNVAKELPPKSLCDVFLKTFLLGVAPVISLVHIFTDIENVQDEISFLPLLWAVLYCGAVSAPSSLLIHHKVEILDKPTLVKRLLDKFNTTLALCKFNTLPTLNSLIALLMTECCSQGEEDVITEGAFTSHAMHIAKSLGLHQENTYSGLDEVERETARRVWWHILYLEVRATIASGSHLLHKSGEAAHSVRMVSELRDQDIRSGVIGDCYLTIDDGPEPRHASTAMLLSIARYEHSRTLRQIVERCYEAVPTKADFDHLEKEIQLYHAMVDSIISRLKVRGIPESGYVSSHLLGANPVTQPTLYEDHPGKETVFNAWTRVVLKMLQLYPWIVFYRQFLGQAAGSCNEIRDLEINLCCSFLQHFLQLARLPAFSPYYWFCPGKMQPLQECMIILTCLQNQPPQANTELPRYLIDEIFAVFSVGNESTDYISSLSFKPSQRYKASWQVVARMYDQIFRDKEIRTLNAKKSTHIDDNLTENTSTIDSMNPGLAESIPNHSELSDQSPTEPESPSVFTPIFTKPSSQFDNFDLEINNLLASTPQATLNPQFFNHFSHDLILKHAVESGGFYDNVADNLPRNCTKIHMDMSHSMQNPASQMSSVGPFLDPKYRQDVLHGSWSEVAHMQLRN